MKEEITKEDILGFLEEHMVTKEEFFAAIDALREDLESSFSHVLSK